MVQLSVCPVSCGSPSDSFSVNELLTTRGYFQIDFVPNNIEVISKQLTPKPFHDLRSQIALNLMAVLYSVTQCSLRALLES